MPEINRTLQEQQPALKAVLVEMTSPEALQSYEERITAEAGAFDYQAETAAITAQEDRVRENIDAIRQQGDLDSHEAAEERLKSLGQEFRNLDTRSKEARKLRDFQEGRAYKWQRHGVLVLDRREDGANDLAKMLITSASTAERHFVDDEVFMHSIDKSKRTVEIVADEEPLEFPAAAFISAASFSSWEEGRDSFLKDGRPSSEVIKDYASRETDIPPVDDARALLLDSGEIVLLTENSHRVAAAKLRGQDTIAVKHLTIHEALPDAPIK